MWGNGHIFFKDPFPSLFSRASFQKIKFFSASLWTYYFMYWFMSVMIDTFRTPACAVFACFSLLVPKGPVFSHFTNRNV